MNFVYVFQILIFTFLSRYLLNDVLTKEQRERVHIFNTFFYQSLTKSKTKAETQAEKEEAKDANGKSLTKY
jgi:Ulp1 family protease